MFSAGNSCCGRVRNLNNSDLGYATRPMVAKQIGKPSQGASPIGHLHQLVIRNRLTSNRSCGGSECQSKPPRRGGGKQSVRIVRSRIGPVVN